MKKNKLFLGMIISIGLLITLVFAGCALEADSSGNKNDKSSERAKKLPGKFQAALLSDTIGNSAGNTARSISLGTFDVANSKNIFFILRNVGDFAITDVAFTAGKLLKNNNTFEPIADNGVKVTPGHITVLETSGKAAVETIIEVNINHGNVAGLISQNYIHKADFAGTTIRITGKTSDGSGSELNAVIDLDIETLIKVCSFEVQYSEDSGTTWKKAEYGKPPYEYISKNFFLIPKSGKDFIKILNTGNVPLRYKVQENLEFYPEGYYSMWESLNNWIDLDSGDSSAVLQYNYSGREYYFIIDTLGVAYDNSGIDELVFRANTSIVVSSANAGGIPAMRFYILYN